MLTGAGSDLVPKSGGRKRKLPKTAVLLLFAVLFGFGASGVFDAKVPELQTPPFKAELGTLDIQKTSASLNRTFQGAVAHRFFDSDGSFGSGGLFVFDDVEPLLSPDSDVDVFLSAPDASEQDLPWVVVYVLIGLNLVLFVLWLVLHLRRSYKSEGDPTVAKVAVQKISPGNSSLMLWLREIVRRGYSLEKGVEILLHSRYNPVQVEEAAQRLRQEGLR